MTPPVPSRDKLTCLMSSCSRPGGGHRLHFQRLRKNGHPHARDLSLGLSPEGEIRDASIPQLLRYLGGYQVVHYSSQDCATRLGSVVSEAGFKPIDNPFHDIAPLVARLCRADGADRPLTLDELAERQGTPITLRRQAQRSARHQSRLLQQAWKNLVYPALTYFDQIPENGMSPPLRDMTPVDLSRHGLPLPAPLVPQLAEPANGWRRAAWDSQEAQDCALRFVEGASLENLSRLFRRSPRAIHARLVLDGILHPE